MAGMGNARHLETGSTRPPPPAKDVLRVYGMKFCPFAQRLKLVLAAKGIKHETVNINLVKKPEWYFDINPRGKVPSLEINGDIIYESDITSAYVDEAYPGRKLITEDPLKKAKEMILLGDHSSMLPAFYGLLGASTDEEKKQNIEKVRNGLSKEEAFLKEHQPFIGGSEPGFTDYMMWTHLERIGILQPTLIPEFPALKAFFDAMGKDKAVIACRHSDDLHKEFFKGVYEKNIIYDIGEVED